ncbi:MAG TPA: tetratricopeptide repeat protein [Dongiaceae bacterium]|nr:tetratricopeptide repeat protein [Dongiaceae bacterium]
MAASGWLGRVLTQAGMAMLIAASVAACTTAGPGNDRADISPISQAALHAAQDAPEIKQAAILSKTVGNHKAIDDLLRKAADIGNPVALVDLGDRHSMNGTGSPEDLVAAVDFYRRAAAMGYAPAETALGKAYRLGEGAALDKAEAAYWYRQAALQKDATGQLLYGIALLGGEGVTKDEAQGMALIQAAADKPDVMAQMLLMTITMMRQATAASSAVSSNGKEDLSPSEIDHMATTAAKVI